MKNMFYGMPNSPVTTLSDNITDTQTIIPVKQTAKLPPAPNIATIGFGNVRETIIYNTKTNTTLEDCTRGIEGTSKEWKQGTEVARYFTAFDHGNIIDNILEIKNKLDNKNNVDFLNVRDTRSDNFPPSYYLRLGKSITSEFKYKSVINNCPVGATKIYAFLVTITGWTDYTGGYPIQIAYGKEGMAFRYGINNDSWSDWIENVTVEQSESFYAPLRNGHTGTIRYSKNKLGHVWLRGDVKLSSTINSGTIIAVIPLEYAPKDHHTVIECYNASRGQTGSLVLFTNGNLCMSPPGMDNFRQGNLIKFNAIYQSGR